VVLAGGTHLGTWYSDTWQWDGANWNQINYPNTPPGRWSAGAAYDRSRGQMLTFGGITSPGSSTPSAWLDQTWVLEQGPSASYTPFGAGCGLPGGTAPVLSAAPGERPILGTASTLVISYQPSAVNLPLLALGFSNTVASGPGGAYPLPFDLSVFGWPGCFQLVSVADLVIAGGSIGSGLATYDITVPALPLLVGLSLHAQAMILHGPFGVSMSNGITAVAGY
jgi:hypothetical protein